MANKAYHNPKGISIGSAILHGSRSWQLHTAIDSYM